MSKEEKAAVFLNTVNNGSVVWKCPFLSQCDSEPGLKGNYKYMEDVHFIIDTFNF